MMRLDVHQPPAEFFEEFSAAYSNDIGTLLGRIATVVHKSKSDFAEQFFDGRLMRRHSSVAFLARLKVQEREQLKHQQTSHLDFLMSARLTPQVHFERALRVGRMHEMAGVDLLHLLEAYERYHQRICRLLPATGLDLQQQQCLEQAVRQRQMLDIEGQMAGHYKVDVETAATVVAIDKAMRGGGNLSDLLHGTLEAISTLDGVSACVFARPDSLG
ncbi:MAG: hypothetical protein KGL42_11320, partial [Betaproteobacteria bacterium]|nr:hypothetical protein [Betaproteobacteria bacterium]